MKRLILTALMLLTLPAFGQKKISELSTFVPTLADFVPAVDSSAGTTGRLTFTLIRPLMLPSGAEVVTALNAQSNTITSANTFSGLNSFTTTATFGDGNSTDGRLRMYTLENAYYVDLVSGIQPFNRTLWVPAAARLSDTIATLSDTRSIANTYMGSHTHDAQTLTNFDEALTGTLIQGTGINIQQGQLQNSLVISSTLTQHYQTISYSLPTALGDMPQRSELRFTQGSNVTLSLVDNQGGDYTEVIIGATGGGGGGTYTAGYGLLLSGGAFRLDTSALVTPSFTNARYPRSIGDSVLTNGQLADTSTFNGETTTTVEGNLNVTGWDVNEQVLAHFFFDDSLDIKRFVANNDYYIIGYLPDSVYATKVVYTQLSTSYDLEVDVAFATTAGGTNYVPLIATAPVMNSTNTPRIENANVFSRSPTLVLVDFNDYNSGDMAYPRGLDITVLGYRK